jgi:hypothetical protein
LLLTSDADRSIIKGDIEVKTLNNLSMRSLFSLMSVRSLRVRIEKLAVALLLVLIPLAGATTPTHAAPNGPYEILRGAILGTPITVSRGGDLLDIFVVGTDHQLYHKAWDGQRWLPSATDYEPLGGLVRDGSTPAVAAWGASRLDIVVVGADRQLYHKAWDGQRWLPSATGYEALGGLVRDGSSPAIASWGSDRLDIVVVGDDRNLAHKAWNGNRWLPSATGYEPLGGPVRGGSSPAIVSWGSDRLDIALVSDDRQIYHKAWNGNQWLPSTTGFEPLGGLVRDGSSPAIVSKGPDRLDIFIVGQDKELDHKAWESTRWLPSLTTLEHLGGIISDGSSPSATSWGGSRVSVFVVGSDQGLYHKGWDGSRWWEYENLGGTIAGGGSSPAATSWGAGRMDVFVKWSDGQLRHKGRNSFEWLGDTKMATVPVSGSTKWAVLLCKTSDHPEEPKDTTFFRNLFTEDGSGLGGMFDYWRDMSYGTITLAGSQVKGWYTMPQTLAQLNALSRQDKIRACVAAGSADFHNPGTNFYAIAVMFNTPSVDSGAAGSANLTFNGVTKVYPVLDLASSVWTPTFTAHEMGHLYGLSHSWSRRPDIEYGDPYDIMSAMRVKTFTRSLPLFGDSGPGLTAVYRDALGWIPQDRIYSSPLVTATIPLAPLEQPNASGYLMAKVFAFGRSDRYYTVEFHRATGWDQGLQQDVVLIHEVLPDRRSYLITDGGGPERRIGVPFIDRIANISIKVLIMDAGGATIQIARAKSDFIIRTHTSSF